MVRLWELFRNDGWRGMTPELQRQLLFELRAIETTDGKELRDIAAATALLGRSDATWRRAFAPGHLTASAFVVHPETAQILLHHHRRLGRWLQLGGHIEPEESPAEASLREAREESGLEDLALLTGTIFDVDVHDIPAGKGEPEHQHFDLRYVVVAPSTEGHSMDPLESLDLAWFTLVDARAKMAAHESLRAIEKIRQILRGR